MNKKFGFLVIVLAGAIGVWGLFSMARLIIIKFHGSQIIATVVKVDTDCDKYNKIEVAFEGKTYPVNISSASCRNGTYKPGQNVSLLKYKDYALIWPESKPEYLPVVFVAVLALAYYTNKDKFARTKKATPKSAFVKK